MVCEYSPFFLFLTDIICTIKMLCVSLHHINNRKIKEMKEERILVSEIAGKATGHLEWLERYLLNKVEMKDFQKQEVQRLVSEAKKDIDEAHKEYCKIVFDNAYNR